MPLPTELTTPPVTKMYLGIHKNNDTPWGAAQSHSIEPRLGCQAHTRIGNFGAVGGGGDEARGRAGLRRLSRRIPCEATHMTPRDVLGDGTGDPPRAAYGESVHGAADRMLFSFAGWFRACKEAAVYPSIKYANVDRLLVSQQVYACCILCHWPIEPCPSLLHVGSAIGQGLSFWRKKGDS